MFDDVVLCSLLHIIVCWICKHC